ncbi:MAG: anaerobic ribonucleoside-triphosphate reductase activating protein [Parcubacteria group bacterium]|jgi:pyruvate formate lyase activating enzyme
MIIGGYQKLTLIDYPGCIATTVFTVGCNFRCPFCHNPELVDLRLERDDRSAQEFFDFLARRVGKLDGVCITGGEPTLQPDIVEFIRKIKAMGFAVKLDSNGTNPTVLQKLIDEKLIDYIAMDIKSQPEKYDAVTGVVGDIVRIKKSVALIMVSGLPYEFRTTVVPGLHEEGDFVVIAQWLKGATTYYLQEYREEQKILDPNLKQETKGKTIDLEKIKKNIKHNFGKVEIRR